MAASESTNQRVARMAAALIAAHHQGTLLTVTPDEGPADAAEACAVQQEVWRALVGTARPTAWKVGAAARDAVFMAGPVLPQFLGASPARFPASSFGQVAVEAEIALRFYRDLPPRPTRYTREELLAAVGSAHVALEVVATRLADRGAAGRLWCLADNLVNGALVLGDPLPDLRDLDFGTLVARSFVNGERVAEGVGQVPLGDIFYLLPWWVEQIGGVRTGDVVTTGTWNGAHWTSAPADLGVEFVGLGSASAHLG